MFRTLISVGCFTKLFILLLQERAQESETILYVTEMQDAIEIFGRMPFTEVWIRVIVIIHVKQFPEDFYTPP